MPTSRVKVRMASIPPWEMKRETTVKDEEETDPQYGSRPEDYSLAKRIRFGIINVDKPPGPTSHEVVAWVKKLLVVDRAGHGGTLEPCEEIPR